MVVMPRTFTIPKQTLPYLVGQKLIQAKLRDGFVNKTWGEYFSYISDKMDINLQPTAQDGVQAATETLFPMWMNNFAENLPYIRSDSAHFISELAAPTVTDKPDGSAIVLGRGPSVFNHNHLELLATAIKNGYKGKIVASDGILIDCLEHGITPDLVVTVDGSILIKKWYDHPLVQGLNVALSLTVNNEVYQTCINHDCTVHWYLPQFDLSFAKESITKVIQEVTKTKHNPKGLVKITLGGNSGSASWVFAAHIFKRSPVCLIGIDFGYPEGTPLRNTPYFSSMIRQASDIEYAYKEVYHPTFKTKAFIDMAFESYKNTFLRLQLMPDLEPWYSKAGGTINATEGGTLFGPKIKCMTFQNFLDKYKT